MCLQATVHVAVLRPEDVVRGMDCEPAVAAATSQVFIPLQDAFDLECPDLQDATRMAAGEPKVTWLYVNPGRVRRTTLSQSQNQNQNLSCLWSVRAVPRTCPGTPLGCRWEPRCAFTPSTCATKAPTTAWSSSRERIGPSSSPGGST